MSEDGDPPIQDAELVEFRPRPEAAAPTDVKLIVIGAVVLGLLGKLERLGVLSAEDVAELLDGVEEGALEAVGDHLGSPAAAQLGTAARQTIRQWRAQLQRWRRSERRGRRWGVIEAG